MTKETRVKLWNELITLSGDRKALNRTRGPLGHGVIYHADKEAKMAALDARMAQLRAELA